eukprot:m.245825 g.245825  ORF g.245825 m.245825 type:complete len:55 (-) comp10958_c1_seq36:919-1083(-)
MGPGEALLKVLQPLCFEQLESRVTLLGGVAHDNICDVLTQGVCHARVPSRSASC